MWFILIHKYTNWADESLSFREDLHLPLLGAGGTAGLGMLLEVQSLV